MSKGEALRLRQPVNTSEEAVAKIRSADSHWAELGADPYGIE